MPGLYLDSAPYRNLLLIIRDRDDRNQAGKQLWVLASWASSPVSLMTKIAACLKPPLLLAIDGSNAHIQKLLQPVVQLLTASTAQPLLTLTVQPRPLRQRIRLRAIAGRNHTNSAQPCLEPSGSDAPGSDTEVTQGRPAATILRYAHQMQAGLIAVEMGSTAAAIARYATCHVLVARGDQSRLGWKRVLLVVDGSKATQQAIALTRQLLPIGTEQVTILCVQPSLNTHHFFGPFATPTLSWQFNQLLREVQREHSQNLIQQAEAALMGMEITTLVQTSEPGLAICQVAAQQQTDVIILGSDAGRRGLQRTDENSTNSPKSEQRRSPLFRHMRLTATGNYVMHHAPCSVLLCRSIASLPQSSTQPLIPYPQVNEA